MKTMLLTTALMSFHLFAMAETPVTDCRDAYVRPTEQTEKARLAADLTSGLWELNQPADHNGVVSMYFHEFGVADQIRNDANGHLTADQVHWTLEEYNGALFLVFSHLNDDGRTNMYRVHQTCEGMDLTDIGSLDRMSLTYRGQKLGSSLTAMAQDMTGEWITGAYPFDLTTSLEDCGTFEPMKDAFFQMSFRGDGTFARSVGNRGMTIRETGYWDLTDDGQYLLLHIFGPEGTGIIRTDVAEVEQAGEGRIDLRQALKNSEGNDLFCTGTKTFGFSRWSPVH